MKRLILIISVLLIPMFVYAQAPDRRISDDDGHVLDITADGNLNATISNFNSSTATKGNLLIADGSAFNAVNALVGDVDSDVDFDPDRDNTDEFTMNADGSLDLVGASGTLIINPNSDGGDYNISTGNGDQQISFFASGGSSELDVEVLDGDLDVVAGGMKPSFQTADPCATFPEASIFWNNTANVLCVCDGTNDVRVTDASTACF